MSRRHWGALRMVAENISAGDRSYWNLLRIPDISARQAGDALTEMVQKGVASVTDFQVEPTAVFDRWLSDLRQQEDAPSTRGPGDQPAAVTLQVQPENAPVTVRNHVVRKPYFRHLSADPRQAALETSARIREQLENLRGNTARLSPLRRAMHGYRHPAAWDEAVRILVQRRHATVADGSITLVWSKDDSLPGAYGRPKNDRRLKRKRKQTKWFKSNRSKMDQGKHSKFDQVWRDEDNDWSIGSQASAAGEQQAQAGWPAPIA